MGDIADIVGGGTPSTNNADYWDGDIDWYAPAEIGDKIFVDSSERKITKEGFENCSAKLLPAGSVLFTSRAGIGKMAILRKESCTNQGFQSIVPHEGELDSYFIFSRSDELKNYGETVGAGSTFVEVSGKQMSNMNLMMPKSYSEQIVIGKYFSQLDDLITLHQRKYNKLLNVKKSMLEKMFPKNGSNIPEIRFKGFTDPWEQRKLKETIEYIVDNRGKNPDYYCSEGIPVIDNFMIRNSLYPDLNTATRFIDENLYQNFIRKYNEEDDILLTLVGNGISNITLFPKDKAVIIQNTLGFRAKEDKKFLFFLLMANNEALVKLDRGMAQPSIRQDEILDLDIYVPSNSEQTQIGEYFSNLDNLITLHQRELEKLQNIKKSMLEKMFV